MSNQQSEYVWKPGKYKSGNIEFCGNWKRLQEKEPAVAALISGHESHEGFETQDDSYRYKIYHSQYGFSVGRRKKQGVSINVVNGGSNNNNSSNGINAVPVSGSNTVTEAGSIEKQETSLTSQQLNDIARSIENHFNRIEILTNSINNLIYCLCANPNSNTDTDNIREKIIKQ